MPYPARRSSIRAMLFVLIVFPLCLSVQPAPFAFGQAGTPGAINGMTKVDYVYNGQSFQFTIMRGEVMMVAQENMPVIMISRGTVRPLMNADPKLVAAAEDAVKAYKAGTPSGGGAAAAPAGGAAAGGGLTVDGVISLLDAGLSDDVILAKIQKNGQSFDLSTDDMIRLKKAKASDAVMKAMMNATPAPSPAVPPRSMGFGGGSASPAPAVVVAPNPVAESPNMGKLKKAGFMSTIGHDVKNAMNGKTVIDRLSMRNILPQWDPNQPIDAQYPHIAITVNYAPMGWMDDYHEVLRRNSILPPCFKLKAVVWLDPTRSKTTDDFEWCVDKDLMMTQLQPSYLFSFQEGRASRNGTTGIERTDGPKPPDKLLPNDRATLDMEAKTNEQGASPDLNLDERSLFAIMFANVRKDLGETLNSDGDYRVWITSIKKASGPSI